MSELRQTVDDLTADWATRALRAAGTIDSTSAVASATAEVIGTGQLGRVVRLTLAYDGEPGAGGPEAVVVKLAAENETSRQTGIALGVYEAEVRFFQEIAPTVEISVPRCHLAELDAATGWFTLVFDDCSRTADVGDMVSGGTPEQAGHALAELAKLQARWSDASLERLAWLADRTRTQALFGAFAGSATKFLDDLGSELTADQADLVERVAPTALDWLNGWAGPFVVQHGDFRLDNMLFAKVPDAPPVTVVDWQTVRLGPPLVDVGFYLGGCLSLSDRRAHERDLLHDYHAALQAVGVRDYSFDDLWADYRRYCLYGLFMAIGTYALVEQTDRGRALFLGAARQYADLALDLDVRAPLVI